MDELTRQILNREAKLLAPTLYEALDGAVADAKTIRFSEREQPHLHSAWRRAAFRETLKAEGLPGDWEVGGNSRQSGQTILVLEHAGIRLRLLSESSVTTNGVPHAGSTAARRHEWRTVTVPLSMFGGEAAPSRNLLLLMNTRSDTPTLRIVRTTEEGRFQGKVACDYRLVMHRDVDTLGNTTFDTTEDDINFYANIDREETGDA